MIPKVILNGRYRCLELTSSAGNLCVEFNTRGNYIEVRRGGCATSYIMYIPYVGVFRCQKPMRSMRIDDSREYVQVITYHNDRAVMYELQLADGKTSYVRLPVDESIFRGLVRRGDCVEHMIELLMIVLRNYMRLNVPVYYVLLKLMLRRERLSHDRFADLNVIPLRGDLIVMYRPGFCCYIKYNNGGKASVSIASLVSSLAMLESVVLQLVLESSMVLDLSLGKIESRRDHVRSTVLDLYFSRS